MPSAIKDFISLLPKTETHLHIEGALPWRLLQERYPEKFCDSPSFRDANFRYSSFEEFERILIDHALEFFDSPDAYFHASSEIFQNHLEQNVKYVEISFHAGMIEFLKIPGEEILNAIKSAAPPSLEVRVYLGISRDAYTPFLGPILEDSLCNWDELTGIDLHGLETLPMAPWIEPFWQRAQVNGRKVKAHAGEFGPAKNVLHAIEKLGVRRIQHGISAINDSSVIELALKENVTFDICPISNYKLQVIDNWSDHPLQSFLAAGINCTLSTDDPLSFNNTLIDEYLVCHEKLGLTVNELGNLARNGFEVSDLPESEKRKWQFEILAALKNFEATNE